MHYVVINYLIRVCACMQTDSAIFLCRSLSCRGKYSMKLQGDSGKYFQKRDGFISVIYCGKHVLLLRFIYCGKFNHP